MDFKYLILYSLDDGEISNAVGCHTLNQSKEIAEMILHYYSAMGCKVDSVEIYEKDGKVISSVTRKNNLN